MVINVRKGIEKSYCWKSEGLKPSGVYIRVGTTKRCATLSEIKKLIVDDQALKGKYFEDGISYNQNLTFKDLQIIERNKNIDISSNMFTLGLTNNDDKFTNLALILSDQNPISVKYAVYDEDNNFIDKQVLTGSILLICEQLTNFASVHNQSSAKIIPGEMKRYELESYPGNTLREMILNAFCHCSYSMSSNIKVEFYKDRCEITSPGGVVNSFQLKIK